MTVNQSWIYQGRQSHGWFGSGTAPEDGGSNAPDEANELFQPANASQRVDYAAHSIIMHVPRNERSLWAYAASDTVRDRLKTVVAAWYGASGLSRDAFRAQFLDPYTSDEVVDRLRSAARGIVEGRSYDELAKAGDDLAAAAQKVGAGQWPRFVGDAGPQAMEAVSRGDIPGVVKISAADEPASVAGLILLGLLAIVVSKTQSNTPRPTKTAPVPSGPALPTVMRQDGPEDTEPPAGQATSTHGSRLPQAPGNPAKTAGGRLALPANPDDLVKGGWIETTNPQAAARGRREFKNPGTEEEIAFDRGRPGRPGFEGQDHCHRTNPGSTGKRDASLDANGNPVPRGSKRSHITSGEP